MTFLLYLGNGLDQHSRFGRYFGAGGLRKSPEVLLFPEISDRNGNNHAARPDC